MKLGFFGLSVESRRYIFDSIFDLVYYGKGGFIYSEVYDMPVWLRTYNLKKLQDAIEAQNAASQGKDTKKAEFDKMPDEVKKLIINKSKIPIKDNK